MPTIFGPVSNKLQYDTVTRVIADAKQRDLRVEAVDADKVPASGFWVPATVVVNPPEDALVVQEEQFGKFSYQKLPIHSRRTSHS